MCRRLEDDVRKYKNYPLKLLNDQDATSLFRLSAFSGENEASNIPDDLVDKSLFFLEKDPQVKQCYMHLGLFPEDQKIAATALLDMWAHLYNHDEGGLPNFITLTKLSFRNLANVLPISIHPLPQFMHNMKGLKVLIITNYGHSFSEIQNFPAPQYLSGLTRIRLDHVSISSISTTILMLENLQKLSLIMCKIGNSFNEGIPSKLTSLSEIDIDSCDDLVTFPAVLCNSVGLKKLSITNCHDLTSLSEEFGKLSNLEVLLVASCSRFKTLPESVTNLKKLRIIDLSHCLSLHELPQHMGELGCLETIDARGWTGLHENGLPKSIKDFNNVKVFCDEETFHLWSDFHSVRVQVVQEDALDTLNKIISRPHI
ncbi:hypothetical protein L1987_54842 [Smallanthus sonchifolius]|uniref:Uncharacterized protein n=1 Tax=Smallanthus sonchifolius TaxID=185202 RepID=A0ACB9E7V9_9ASTR|nr:hypothetical protein L1987_54842 [Smallanthus sonchifolius]